VAKADQVLRFGVGAPEGPRSGVWRLWVPKGTSDVYLSRRALGRDFKVSLHASGKWRAALTSEYVRRPDANVIPGPDPRGSKKWQRPEPQAGSAPSTHALTIVVPWWEVREWPFVEEGKIVWAEVPPEGWCVEFVLMYVPLEMTVTEHPGARAMNSKLVGEVGLTNGERVFVVWWTHVMEEPLLGNTERLRRARILDADGELIEGKSLLSFGIENGIGVFLDVTNDPT
jgi:hypothetical protein